MELRTMPSRNERIELETKIMKYRQLARHAVADHETAQRTQALVANLERQLREIDK